jgi:S-DNA-T family DNA segregation ATPase FtsK/SpoIIIE
VLANHNPLLTRSEAHPEVDTREGVRCLGGHIGWVAMRVTDADPYATPPLHTARRGVLGCLAGGAVWPGLLVGAIPRQGKTFASPLLVPAIRVA